MNWFVAHGTKLLAFISGIATLLTTQAAQLHLSALMLSWVAFVASVATLASAVFFTAADQSAALTKLKGPKS